MATLTAGGNSSATLVLDAFASVTVVADASCNGTLSFVSDAQNLLSNKTAKVQNKTYGPYGVPGTVTISITAGSLTYTVNGNTGGFDYDASGHITGLAGLATDTPGNAKFLIGTDSASAAGDEVFNVTRVDTNAGALTRPLMSLFEHAIAPAAAPGVTTDFHCIDARVYGSSANIDATTRFYCIEGKATCQKASGSMARTVGLMGSSVMTGAGTLDLAVGVQTDVQNTGAGTVTEGVGIYIPNGVNSGGGTLTTLYGIKIENQTAGATNYSIYTSQGRVRFFGGTAIPAGGTAGVGVTFSNTSNFGTFFGSGAPSLAAAKGSLYLRSDGSTTNDRAYINTNGGSTWTALTTVA